MSRSPEERSCDRIQESLEAWLDGELGVETAARIRDHLDGCQPCAAQARLAQEIRNELRALPELDAPPAVVQEIFSRTSRAPVPHRRGSWLPTRLIRPAWAALAAAILALVIGISMFQRPSTEHRRSDAAAIAQATAEARFALAKTGLLTRKAGLAVRDRALRDQIVLPTQKGLSRSLKQFSPSTGEAPPEGADHV